MTAPAALVTALPSLQPEDPGARLLLFAIRQMGRYGTTDACAAHAFLCAFGKGFRRPLLLLRALMRDMAMVSTGPIPIAPWCCPRITGCEATLLAALGHAGSNAPAAQLLFADLLGVRDASGVTAVAAALSAAFADLGLPIGP